MALLGVHYGAQFATLAGALDSWATEGLIDLLARAVDGATAVVITLVGREMSGRLDPDALNDGAVVATLRAWSRPWSGPWSQPWPWRRPRWGEHDRRLGGRGA